MLEARLDALFAGYFRPDGELEDESESGAAADGAGNDTGKASSSAGHCCLSPASTPVTLITLTLTASALTGTLTIRPFTHSLLARPASQT